MRILILVIFDHIYPGLSILHISTYFYIFLHWFLHFLPGFWVNFPEILRWKDLGGGTASSKTAGGGGAGGASASDFAVMDLGLPRFRWWDWRLAISTMSGMTKPK